MPDISFGRVPFAEQIAFFRHKLNVNTESYLDVFGDEHDLSFMVAGANRDALVADFRAAVDKVIAEGGTLEDFRRDFDRIVAKYGWEYNGARNWRSRVIYETNLRTSYAAGRWQQLQALKVDRPYWRYMHKDGERYPRPLHQHWGAIQLTLRADDPWWLTHYPPNGWGCGCSVRALNARDLKRLGKDGPDTAPPPDMQTVTVGQRSPGGPIDIETPAGVDPGFGYAPGRRAGLDAFVPREAPERGLGTVPRPVGVAHDPLPAPRALPPNAIMPEGLTDADYINAFLRPFNAITEPQIFTDVTGERLAISDQLFREADGTLKLYKRGRERYVKLYAEAIQHPDEVWLSAVTGNGSTTLRRRYIAQWKTSDADVPALVVFEYGRDAWTGVTAFRPDDVNNLMNGGRRGVRIYRRPD